MQRLGSTLHQPSLTCVCVVCSAVAKQSWTDDKLERLQALVNNTPQDQRAALLNQGDPEYFVSFWLCRVNNQEHQLLNVGLTG
jgi:hypothetical protein